MADKNQGGGDGGPPPKRAMRSPGRFLAHSPTGRSPGGTARRAAAGGAVVVATAAMVALPEPVMAALPGPTVHGMETPPQGRALPASPIGTPPVVIEPGAGCSLEELRIWVIQKFGHVNRDATELEVRAGARINQVAFAAEETSLRLAVAEPIVRASAAALNDVGVFRQHQEFRH